MKTQISDILDVFDKNMDCHYTDDLADNINETNITATGVSIDSRTLAPGEIFFALKGETTNGHLFIAEALQKGASMVVAEKSTTIATTLKTDLTNRPFTDPAIVYVPSVLRALQVLACWHRKTLFKQVLAVTGSNGKTLFKDALKTIFARHSVIASPGSYNGALGLPLSILQANDVTELGIFEVGVAGPNSMSQLQDIVKPTFGVLINIGMAHIAAYQNREQIAEEKLKLFTDIPENGWILVPDINNEPLMKKALKLNCKVHELGKGPGAISLEMIKTQGTSTIIQLDAEQLSPIRIEVKTTSPEIIADLHFAASAAYLLGIPLTEIADALKDYEPSPTRMEVWTSPTGIRVINDSHSSDPISVGVALRTAASLSDGDNYYSEKTTKKRIFAFSGMRELGEASIKHHEKVGRLAAEYDFTHLYIVTNSDSELDNLTESLQATVAGFTSRTNQNQTKEVRYIETKHLRKHLIDELSSGDTVLYKGPRTCGMTTAVNDLIGSISQRCLKIDLTSIKENISQIRRIGNGAKVMAMLKALAYGTELEKIAYWASHLGINCIGVSSAAEGGSLRRSGFSDDIYIFLSDKNDIDEIIFNNLTPILYSHSMLTQFQQKLQQTNAIIDVHLKVDTGMHRLGVPPEDVLILAQDIKKSKNLRLTGVCTHLAAADDAQQDAFTHQQLDCFDQIKEQLSTNGFDNLVYHAANSAAAIRFKRAHYDMIRPGLALYGLYPSMDVSKVVKLSLAIAVISNVIDIRNVSRNESIGYAREYNTGEKDHRIACIPFGYDDGLPWSLNRKSDNCGYVNISGHNLNIIGRISMDQILVDITESADIQIGDDVLIYGQNNGFQIRPEEIADKAFTIPHELLVRLGNRVQRIFVESS